MQPAVKADISAYSLLDALAKKAKSMKAMEKKKQKSKNNSPYDDCGDISRQQ
jgi:hypothetical protein